MRCPGLHCPGCNSRTVPIGLLVLIGLGAWLYEQTAGLRHELARIEPPAVPVIVVAGSIATAAVVVLVAVACVRLAAADRAYVRSRNQLTQSARVLSIKLAPPAEQPAVEGGPFAKRVRGELLAATETVEPSPDGLAKITARLRARRLSSERR